MAVNPNPAIDVEYLVHIALVWAVDSVPVVSRADGSGSITLSSRCTVPPSSSDATVMGTLVSAVTAVIWPAMSPPWSSSAPTPPIFPALAESATLAGVAVITHNTCPAFSSTLKVSRHGLSGSRSMLAASVPPDEVVLGALLVDTGS